MDGSAYRAIYSSALPVILVKSWFLEPECKKKRQDTVSGGKDIFAIKLERK